MTPYRHIAAVEFAAGLALAGAARWFPNVADLLVMAGLALMFFAGRNWQRGA